jgi:hypothetical protein
MKWSRASSLDVIFIKIDFENAYNQVDWSFILAMLKTLRFEPTFLMWKPSLKMLQHVSLLINAYQRKLGCFILLNKVSLGSNALCHGRRGTWLFA